MNKLNYLEYMGIQSWVRKATLEPSISDDNHYEFLKQQALACVACPLSQTRTQVVFGVGNSKASLMIIGEAPGFYEDQQGEPFVGKAGKLLNSMLKSIGLSREEVYIANILKCRPPNNRDPSPEEINACTHFLEQQINLVQPKILLALGRIAGKFLTQRESSLSSLRGKPHRYREVPLWVTYHPAYLLRNPKDKALAYQDLLKVKACI